MPHACILHTAHIHKPRQTIAYVMRRLGSLAPPTLLCAHNRCATRFAILTLYKAPVVSPKSNTHAHAKTGVCVCAGAFHHLTQMK